MKTNGQSTEVTEAGPQGPESPAKTYTATYARAFPDADVQSLEAHLGVTSASAALTRGLEARIRELGFELTQPRYSTLRALYLAVDHTLPQSKIGETLRISAPYLTEVVDALAKDGWLKRIVKRPDRRVTYLQLTPSGQERCANLVPAIMQYMVDSVSCLTEEQRLQLAHLTNKVWVHLHARRRD